MRRQRRFQSALRKFQRFHRIAADRNLELRWCYKGRPGTFLEHVCPAVGCPGRNSRRPGLGWWRRSIGERRSWLFPLYYTTDQGWWMLPGVQAHRQEMFCCNPTWHVGNWSHQHTDWGVGTSGWELGFVDVNDLVSCNVYAQPLSLWLFWRLISQWPFKPLVDKRGKAVVPRAVESESHHPTPTPAPGNFDYPTPTFSCISYLKWLFFSDKCINPPCSFQEYGNWF